MNRSFLIFVRGGGDLATGTILRLSCAGYRVVVLECREPTAIRREAAFSEAVRLGEKTVEGITCRFLPPAEAVRDAAPGHPTLMIDETGGSISLFHPDVLVDAIIAKKNLGTRKDMAGLTIALGPGFEAGEDVHYVIETMRGHDLGRIIRRGSALPNTGVPGIIAGYGKERVIHAPAEGILICLRKIGDLVEKDEEIALIRGGKAGCIPVRSRIKGVLRGILPDDFPVKEGMKMADVDPRPDQQRNCFTVSDKSRCIAGSVLELVSAYEKKHLF